MKHFLSYTIFMFAGLVAFAQGPRGERGERGDGKGFNAQLYKKSLEETVTKEANLTPQEAEKIFPIIHEMRDKIRNIKDEERRMFRNSKDLTESEYEKMLTKSCEYGIEEHKIEMTYYKKLHSVISWKKINTIRRSIKIFEMQALMKFSPDKKGPRGPMEMDDMGNGKRKGTRL